MAARFAMLAELAPEDERTSHVLFVVQGLGLLTQLELGGGVQQQGGGGGRGGGVAKLEALIGDGSLYPAKFCLWRERTAWGAAAEGPAGDHRASPLGAPPMPWRVGDLVLVSEARRARDYQGVCTLQATRNSTTLVLARASSGSWELAAACGELGRRCAAVPGAARLAGLLALLARSPPSAAALTLKLWRELHNFPRGTPVQQGALASASAAADAAPQSVYQHSLAAGFTQYLDTGTQAAPAPSPYLEVEDYAAAGEAGMEEEEGEEEEEEEVEVERDTLSAIIFQDGRGGSSTAWLIIERQGAEGGASSSSSSSSGGAAPFVAPLDLASPRAAIEALLPVLCDACGSCAQVDSRGFAAACTRAGCAGRAFSRGFAQAWVRFAASGQWARCPQRVLERLLGGVSPVRLFGALSVGASASASATGYGTQGGGSLAGTQLRAAQGEAAASAAAAALRELLQALVAGPGSSSPSRWFLEVRV